RRPTPKRHAGFLGDICECAVMIVVVKPVLPKVRDVNIRPPVVVIIADRDSDSPSLIRDASFLCDIRKSPVTIIVEKHGSRWCFLPLQRRDGRTIKKIDVEPAVVVIV